MNRQFDKYCYYTSYDLLNTVKKYCESTYLNSEKYSALRLALCLRLRYVGMLTKYEIGVLYRKAAYINVANAETLQWKILSNDFDMYLKYNEPVKIKKFYKNLKKNLQTMLNKLDNCWGYYSVFGYGMNYGKNHIEMQNTNLEEFK